MKNYLKTVKSVIAIAMIFCAFISKAQESITISNNKIIFPNGSEQTTAATSSGNSGIWTIVEPSGADDGAAINQALTDYSHVSLLPNKKYIINSTRIIIGENSSTSYPTDAKTLYVPANTTIEFDRGSSSFSAIELRSNGNLIGEGKIVMKDATWSWSQGKAAVMVNGQYAKLDFGTIEGFEYGISMGGETGIQGCNLKVKYFLNNVILVVINPNGDGWVNQNYIHIDGMHTDGGRRSHSAWANSCGIYMDPGVSPHMPNMNTFSGHIEGMNIGIKLTGKFNRLEGLRLENCTTKIQIEGSVVENNYLYGTYGEITGLETSSNGQKPIRNYTGKSLNDVLSIYGMDEFTYMNVAYQNGSLITSDATLKTDIEDVNGALNKILSLRGTKYNLKSKQKNDNTKNYGFIAQELKEVLPELVVKSDLDDMYAVNYDGVIPVLVEAFKEQQQLIEEKDKDIEELRQMNAEIVNILKEKGILSDNSLVLESEEAILYQNTPNPFTSETEIRFYLPQYVSDAYILVMDMNGKLLKQIDIYSRGDSKIAVGANEFASGMYIYTLIADDKTIGTRRMILTE